MKKIESGRSMIEMLGVLAIIGVLSIGGLAAYNSAMDRNTANNILDYVKEFCCFLSNVNKNQPQVYMCPLPLIFLSCFQKLFSSVQSLSHVRLFVTP